MTRPNAIRLLAAVVVLITIAAIFAVIEPGPVTIFVFIALAGLATSGVDAVLRRK